MNIININKNEEKFNVVTLGSRDYYQVSISLYERNKLGYLITDFYARWPFSLLTDKRHCKDLKGAKLISLYPFFFLAKLLSKSAKLNSFRRVSVDYFFGFFSGFITWITYDRAIVYSYYIEGFVAFYKLIGKKPKSLICFQVHPSPWYINNLINADSKTSQSSGLPPFQEDLEASYTKNQICRYISSLAFCDSVICASSFTARSIFEGTDLDIRTGIIPYGSKLDSYESEKNIPHTGKIRLISVCQLTQRKGMHWAFQAMSQCGCADKFEWVVVSNKIDKAIADMAPPNVKFMSNLSDDELATLFSNSDLFVMPSMVEGFGLVYIEALSKGLPIVYTENTGPNDFCIEGVHGFKVESSSLNSLISLFQKLGDNPGILKNMRTDCIELSSQINWKNFRKLIGDFIIS